MERNALDSEGEKQTDRDDVLCAKSWPKHD